MNQALKQRDMFFKWLYYAGATLLLVLVQSLVLNRICVWGVHPFLPPLIAAITAMYFDLVPVVFAKKAQPNTMTEEFYGAPVKSFTKGTVSIARVSKNYLNANDKVLIIDDFLAHGEAAAGLANLVEQAGGTVCGIAAIIEKEFQGGSKKLRDAGYLVDSLAVITKVENGKIYFKD